MIRPIISYLLKAFFHLLYHGMSFLYDLVADVVSLGRWQDWIYSIISDLEDEPIVELGHGPGHLQKALLKSGRLIFGLDESRQMSGLARKRLNGLPFRLIRADARRLPLQSESIPTIVATFPSEYIFQTETLSEIARTLTPTGKAVILLAAWPGGSSLLEKAAQLLFRITGESPPENTDYAAYSQKLDDIGFKSEITFRDCQKTRLLLIILNKNTQNLTK
ncbi:MAG: class I SAM-dependent methyltransferase [Anaerolineaceae bacterium]